MILNWSELIKIFWLSIRGVQYNCKFRHAKIYSKITALMKHCKGTVSRDMHWCLIDMSWRTRPEKCLGVVLKFSLFFTVFVFNEITGACFPLAGGFANVFRHHASLTWPTGVSCHLHSTQSKETFKRTEHHKTIFKKSGETYVAFVLNKGGLKKFQKPAPALDQA